MRKLSKYEKETIINWNEAENLASIYTFNASLKRRLAEFSRKYPLLCRLERSTPEGSVTYVLDKSRLSIRLVPPYSEERKAAAREYAKEHGFQVGGGGRKNRLKSGHLRKNAGSAPGVLTGNPRRHIPYPLLAYGRKCADTEPVKLAEAAPAVEARFAGAGVQRAASPLCRGAGAAAHCWGQGATPIGGYRAAAPVRCVEAASLYSGVQRWKTSAQGKLMPASTCTGYYLTQTFAGFAASPPSPAP